jgi:predicted transposase YbfD/YdcC
MSNQLISKRAILLFSIVLSFVVAAVSVYVLRANYSSVTAATLVADKCAAVTSKDLTKSIYTQISTKYDGQKSHINVSVTDNIVTLEGWATIKDVKKDVEKIAKKTACVKKVVNLLTIGVSGGCEPRQVQCGDICVRSGSSCAIGLLNSN